MPASHPRYNTSYDLARSYLAERLPEQSLSDLEAKRRARDKQTLIEWLDHNGSRDSYLLMRSRLYDLLAEDLSGRVTPLYRESGMKRNELTLLHVEGNRPTAAATQSSTRR